MSIIANLIAAFGALILFIGSAMLATVTFEYYVVAIMCLYFMFMFIQDAVRSRVV